LQGRQNLQVDKIQEGVDTGNLTKHETKNLIQGQKKINETAQDAMSDDKLSRREARKIEKLQDKESRSIEKKIDNEKIDHEIQQLPADDKDK
jgi:CRISPR/Cas system-associated endoribonuclease Cas2